MTRHTSRWSRVTTLAPLGLAAVLAAGSTGCTRENEQKAERAAEKVGEAAEKAGEKVGAAAEKAGEKIGQAAEKIGDKIGPASEDAARSARDAAAKGARAAAAAGSDAAVSAAAVLRTGAVKAALLQDRSIDVSDVDVTTDQVARRVTLKGRVATAAVRDKVVDIARDAAPGYTIDNELSIR
jgi:phosphoenolpyruvate-protein kinase (PTS system EI component)